jgi:hypothetical protein
MIHSNLSLPLLELGIEESSFKSKKMWALSILLDSYSDCLRDKAHPLACINLLVLRRNPPDEYRHRLRLVTYLENAPSRPRRNQHRDARAPFCGRTVQFLTSLVAYLVVEVPNHHPHSRHWEVWHELRHP